MILGISMECIGVFPFEGILPSWVWVEYGSVCQQKELITYAYVYIYIYIYAHALCIYQGLGLGGEYVYIYWHHPLKPFDQLPAHCRTYSKANDEPYQACLHTVIHACKHAYTHTCIHTFTHI